MDTNSMRIDAKQLVAEVYLQHKHSGIYSVLDDCGNSDPSESELERLLQ